LDCFSPFEKSPLTSLLKKVFFLSSHFLKGGEGDLERFKEGFLGKGDFYVGNEYRKGFTIIEFLIAFFVLSIALIGSSVFFYTNSMNMTESSIKRLATWKAIEKMENIKATDPSALKTGTTTEQITIVKDGENIQGTRITSISGNTSLDTVTVEIKIPPDGKSIVYFSTIIAK